MKSAWHYRWRNWMLVWNLVLALALSVFLFVLLNVVSAGVFVSLVTVAAFFAVYGVVHYLFWGRDFEAEAQPLERAPAALPEPFTIELSDAERTELLRMLAEPTPVPQTQERVRVRRNLRERLRMYGA